MAFENPQVHGVVEVAAETLDIGAGCLSVELHMKQHGKDCAIVEMTFAPGAKPYAERLAAAINALLDVPAKAEAA